MPSAYANLLKTAPLRKLEGRLNFDFCGVSRGWVSSLPFYGKNLASGRMGVDPSQLVLIFFLLRKKFFFVIFDFAFSLC